MKRIIIFLLLIVSYCDLKSQFDSLTQVHKFIEDSISVRPEKLRSSTLQKAYQGILKFIPRRINDTTIVINEDTIKVGGNGTISNVKPIFFVRDYHPSGDGATDDRIAIQNAINAAAISKGIVVFDNVAYAIGTTSSGGITRGLTMAEGVSLWIPPGATLKVKNSSIVTGSPVQLIHIPANAKDVYIGWPNGQGGTLDGNTANQPTWTTVPQYAQTQGNYLIGAAAGFDGITIENLKFTRSFSNAINLGVGSTYGNAKNVVLRNLFIENFGEGAQIIATDNVTVENVTHVMNASIVEGDGLELAFCRNFSILGCRTYTSGDTTISKGGSGIDLFASRNGSVANFYINGTVYGFQIETDFSNNTKNPDDITITNGTIKSVGFSPFIITGGNISVTNVQALDCKQNGPQLSKAANAAIIPRYRFDNVKLSGRCVFYLNDSIKFSGANIDIHISQSGVGAMSISSPELDIDGVKIKSDSSIAALFIADGKSPSGRIINISADSVYNNARNIVLGSGSNLSKLILQGNPPLKVLQGLVAPLAGAQVAVISTNVNSSNLPVGSKNQRVTINGQYQASFTNGSRLKLMNGLNATLPTINDEITLEYGNDDIWREVGRSITSVNNLQTFQNVTDQGATTTNKVNIIDTASGNYNGISGIRVTNNLNKWWQIGYGNTGYQYGSRFSFVHSSGNFFTIDSASNLGLGTAPAVQFHILRNGSDAEIRLQNISSNNSQISYYTNGSFRGIEGFDASGNRFNYHGASNTYTSFIFPNGRIRFGNANGVEDGSGYKVQVDGGVHTSDSLFSNTSVFSRGTQKWFGLFPDSENEFVKIGAKSNHGVKFISNGFDVFAINPYDVRFFSSVGYGSVHSLSDIGNDDFVSKSMLIGYSPGGGGPGVDSIWRDGDSIRFSINGIAYAIVDNVGEGTIGAGTVTGFDAYWLKDTHNNIDGTKTLFANTYLHRVVIRSSVNIADLKIGSTAGASDIWNGPITADDTDHTNDVVLDIGLWIPKDKTIYFTGLLGTGGTMRIWYHRDAAIDPIID